MALRIYLLLFSVTLIGIYSYQYNLIKTIEKGSVELKDVVKREYSEIPQIESIYQSDEIQRLDNYFDSEVYIIEDHLRRMKQTNWILLSLNMLLIVGFVVYQTMQKRITN